MKIDLSIIIVNWNSCDYLIPCIRSIREQTQNVKYEIIVVDNASYDGCGEKLAQDFPDVIFIQSEQNLGFAKANNLGAAQARGRVLLFLNPDTKIINGAIDHLYSALQTLPKAGTIGCRLLNIDGSVQTSSIQSFPTILNQLLDTNILRRFFPKSGLWGTAPLFNGDTFPAMVDVVSGACLMIKRPVFESVGMFSPEYFMYSEDVDLCFKVHQAGWKTYYLPTAVVIHYGGKSSSKKENNKFSSVLMLESRWRFFRKTRSLLFCSVYRFAIFCISIIRLGLILSALPVFKLRGKATGFLNTFYKWKKRLCWSLGFETWVKDY